MSFSHERFTATLAGLELAPDSTLFEALHAAHTEPGRHYHDTSHIAECLAALDAVRGLARAPHEIELALWFHDAVYDPRAADNEARSAAWAQHWLAERGAPTGRIERICAMILATRNHQPIGSDAALMVDIDLGILGQPPAVFTRYDRAIRREYHFVPEADYRTGRAAVLAGFLARPGIYATPLFRSRLEAPARSNLASALAMLRGTQPTGPIDRAD